MSDFTDDSSPGRVTIIATPNGLVLSTPNGEFTIRSTVGETTREVDPAALYGIGSTDPVEPELAAIGTD